jgi:uncharacterized protein (TIGR03435 family)
MIRSLLCVFLTLSVASFGQFELPGLYGKIETPTKAGDVAREISFSKAWHDGDPASWSLGNFDGRLTVVSFLPYVSGNLDSVNRWNALVDQFASKPVQFAWVAGEKEETLFPFLREHPVKGWLFNDLDGATGKAYGLEDPETIFIGGDHRIIGFQPGLEPPAETIDGILENRVTTTPPAPDLKSALAFAQSSQVLLSAEPHRMPRPQDNRPAFAPSYEVHIQVSADKNSGGNSRSYDYWSLKGYTVRRALAEALDVNPIRIVLPPEADTKEHYDFEIVLPQPQSPESQRELMRRAIEDKFHLASASERRLQDVYVLTASDPKLTPAPADSFGGGGVLTSRVSTADFESIADLENGSLDIRQDVNSFGSISVSNDTVDGFCRMLEMNLDRPLVNETRIQGNFDFTVRGNEGAPDHPSKRDFVERLRAQLGLSIAPAQRYLETTVFRAR